MHASKEAPNPLIVYIAGYGRSGSTILDVLLSQSEDAIGCGELAEIFFEFGRGDAVCGCGESYKTCPIWGDLYSKYSGSSAELERHRRRRESRKAGVLNFRRIDVGADHYRESWADIFDHLGRRGYRYIIDSSKSAKHSARRPQFLVNSLGLNVKVIHLTRSWSAVRMSVSRGSNRALEGHGSDRFLPVARAWAGKKLADHYAKRARRVLQQDSFLNVSYEELLANPVGELKKISSFLEYDLSDACEKVASGEALRTSHQVGGNRLRLQKEIVFKTPS